MKKKLAVVTWHTSENYGTCIQCYALVTYLRNEGYTVIVPDSYRYYYDFKHPIETFENLVFKFRKLLKKDKRSKDLSEEYYIRYDKNKYFAIHNTGITVIKSKNEYNNMITSTDVFITGSDQIWNPSQVTPPMLLRMANDDQRKVAYGSSIGVNSLPENRVNYYKKCLEKFDYIGVRENTAKRVIEKFINKEVNVVLDPSFLLDVTEWAKVAIKPKNIHDPHSKFAFCYFVRKYIPQEQIEEYCHDHGLTPLYLLSENSCVPKTSGIILSDAGVGEFIWGIIHSDYVFTDSFHATALSINFGKSFFVYKRFKDGDQHSQNSRITDLLSLFRLEDRMIEENQVLEKTAINYKHVNDILNNEIEKSKKFLISSIENE